MDANPTLDQLAIFAAIAEHGGFSAAARALNRSQSVVSYAIANLEEQLQVALFEREGLRQPKLTPAGEALLVDARRVLGEVDGMRARARGLRQGLEPEVVAAVDSTVPMQALAEVLRAFEATFPTVALRLHVGAIGVVHDQVERRVAHVGFGGEMLRPSRDVVGERIGDTALVPVAAPSHPLAQAARPTPLADVRIHTQIVITDVTDQTRGRDFGVLADRTWRMTDMGLKRELILAGLGWGGLPAPAVMDDIAAGRLVFLDLEDYPVRAIALFARHHAAAPPGPATRWMIERFRLELSHCSEFGASHPLLQRDFEQVEQAATGRPAARKTAGDEPKA